MLPLGSRGKARVQHGIPTSLLDSAFEVVGTGNEQSRGQHDAGMSFKEPEPVCAIK